MAHIHGVMLDIDGTLIDSNDAQAKAWVEAMAEYGYYVPIEKVRPLIGMGGDKVLPIALALQKESEDGKKISAKRRQIFLQLYLPGLRPFPKAKELIQHMRECGLNIAIASSAEPDELKAMLQLIDASDLVEEISTSEEVKRSKPDPDVIEVTLNKMGLPPDQVVMIGDTPYDIEAARKAGVATIAFRCGGWTDKELAGAIAIYNDPADLLAHYATSPLGEQCQGKPQP
jgi:HAD superfamily hydrolase (TIGR01509 family)